MIRTSKDRTGEEGFILMGLSIFLIVVGLLVSAYLYMAKIKQERERKDRMDFAYTSVMNQLAVYLSENGRYPCPAANNLSPGDPNYGVETNCSVTTVLPNNCSATNPGGTPGGYCVGQNPSSGKRIRIGIVPFKTLQLDPQDAVDAYGRFMTYVITEPQATAAGYNADTGAGVVYNSYDATGAMTTKTIDFAVLSHGEDGRGSYQPNGRAYGLGCMYPPAPTPYPADNENCDGDHIIENRPYASATGSSHFDDQVETVLLKWVYIWDSRFGDYYSSYSRGPLNSNIGVGNDNPTARLHIGQSGTGNLKIENGYLGTKSLCDRNGNNCFNPNVLGGSTAQSEGMNCGTSLLMTDIKTGQPVCGTFSGSPSAACPTDSFYTGMNSISGTTIEITCTNAIDGSVTTVTLQ